MLVLVNTVPPPGFLCAGSTGRVDFVHHSGFVLRDTIDVETNYAAAYSDRL